MIRPQLRKGVTTFGVVAPGCNREVVDTSTCAHEPVDGSEPDILVGWLRFHRDALASKATGLTAEQLTEAGAPPSAMTILGLVRHMTEMERVVRGLGKFGGRGPRSSSTATTWMAARNGTSKSSDRRSSGVVQGTWFPAEGARAGVMEDRGHDGRPIGSVDAVAGSIDRQQRGAGDLLGQHLAVCEREHRVGRAVDHQRRHGDR